MTCNHWCARCIQHVLCVTLLQCIYIFYMELKIEGVLPILLMGLVLLIIELKGVLLFKLCCDKEIIVGGFRSTRRNPTKIILHALLAEMFMLGHMFQTPCKFVEGII
jgi:hypothetical protein